MLLLAIDTSTTAITVGLHDGSSVVAESTTLDARAHAEHLAPNIRAALASAGAEPGDVTDVVVGIGPGPFTGLRVGIVTGRTFAFALGLPVRGLTSLDAIAHEAWLEGRRGDLLVATDARRKEVYAAAYVLGDERVDRVAEPVVSRAADLPAELRALPTAGRGPSLYADALPGAVAPLDVSGGVLADLAACRLHESPPVPDAELQRVDPGHGFDGLEPLYLRRPDAAPAPPSKKSTLG
ncbi:tRNA (adenosine(37)-N6)-threonylcarbamoyltransferase complex dimerization subunit type 1 TsaB [Terrabacter carboxydivorans]|uniref:tRNA (Adenosine(37)-N6)-threonylcarbamoyltransferase complex dimerization subunit type 1 TsaB n=1 Tax=Terrabacter carboxydivorans TaxID=619730 RepID=A0ABN3M9S0_9MICO